MKNDRLIPGLILVLIGLVILFDNLGYISFYWDDIFNLWPLFIIVAGVSLVFAHSRSALTTVIKVVVIVAAFAFVIFRYGEFGPGVHEHKGWGWNWHHHHDHDNNDSDNDNDNDDNDGTVVISGGSKDTAATKAMVKADGSHEYKLSYGPNTKNAELNISGGASDYALNDSTSQLFDAVTEQHFGGDYELQSHNDGSNYVLSFKMNSDRDMHWSGDHDKGNKVVLKLNPNPIWDINLKMGAVSMNFDLSKFKIQRLNVKGLAGSFDIKMGEPLENTNIKLATGAASNDISIPKDAACRIESSTIFSSNNFKEAGFQEVDGGYETPNFKSAKNKLYINMDGLAGSFDIHRY